MASIKREISLQAAPARVWDALRDVGALHRLVPGFVRSTVLDGEARIVTFENGMVVREIVIDVDDASMRVAWTVVGSERLTHHNASAQVFPEGDGCRFVWIADVLPHTAAPGVAALIEAALAALERSHAQSL